MRRISRRNAVRLIYAAIAAVSAAIGVLSQQVPFIRQIELRSYDYRFQWRGGSSTSAPIPITIIAIDDESLNRIPEPLMLWPRHIAVVLEALAAGGAGAAGIDIVFSDIAMWDPEGQQLLNQTLLRSGPAGLPIVLGYRVRGQGVEQPPMSIGAAAAAAGHTFGYINLTADPDDFVRRQLLEAPGPAGEPGTSFPLALATAYREKTAGGPLDLARPASTILINYRERGAFPRVSFAEALDAARRRDAGFFEQRFQNRIVLIGIVGGRGGEDMHSTPHYYWSYSTVDGWRTPGIEIHASTIATLLDGSAIAEWPLSRQISAAALAASMLTLVWASLRPFPAIVATGMMAAIMSGATIFAFSRGVWVWFLTWMLSGAAAFGLTQSANYVLEGREKRRVRELFGRYVSDHVIAQLLLRPSEVVLDGERRRVAVLFADIKGFTTRSEASTPESIVQLLNDYFGEIVGVIQTHGGTVNSLIGDGIMATFGAPLDDPDAAFHAVRAAQEMMRALETVNRRLALRQVEPISIGIGINSGHAVVGNMGSPRKMEYTAIGDVVNTAARIEGETRKVAADILISRDAYDWLGQRLPAEYAGEFRLKGRSSPVALYKVLW